jgi:glycosyltransferase involved in cell wall biosynthesis
MRILHIGSGFRPWRRGGLVAYAEDLMAEQRRRGHDVAYFFSGRQYPHGRGPRLRRWEREGIPMLEVVNSPLYDHGRQPLLELSEPHTERMLECVLAELRPALVHLQELAGLPSSVIDVVRTAGIPVVLTLQDYYLLCPAFKLLDSQGAVCLRTDIGADCVATIAADTRESGMLIEGTIRHDIPRLPLLRRIDPGRIDIDRRVAPLALPMSRHAASRRSLPGHGPAAGAAAFQRRRDVNVERLNRADRLIAMSSRVAEIYAELGVNPALLRTVQLTLRHIEELRPREPGRGEPLTFATLSGLESPAKGAHVLRDALRSLSDTAANGQFRLLVYGYHDADVAGEVAHLPGVEMRGLYRTDQLNSILDDVDVGIVASVWEEAYGYVGPELLAKGIPVIGNAIGGIVDYVREGETGWLNRSCSGDELARIMRRLVEYPEQVDALSAKVREDRDSLVKRMTDHADEMDKIYGELAT